MAADKIIRNSKLDTFLSKLATKLAAIFWRKAETTQVSIDNTPTASSNNLVTSGGVKDYVDSLAGGGAIVLTQAEYDALQTKDADALYIVRPDDNSVYVVITAGVAALDIVEVGDGWDISDLTNNPPSSFYYSAGSVGDINMWFPFDETGPSTWTLSGNTLTQSLSPSGTITYTLTDGIPTSATISL